MIASTVKVVPTTPNATPAPNLCAAKTDTIIDATTVKITAMCGVRCTGWVRPKTAGSEPDRPIAKSTRLQLFTAAVADPTFELISAKKTSTQPLCHEFLASCTQSLPPVFVWKATMFMSAPTFHA